RAARRRWLVPAVSVRRPAWLLPLAAALALLFVAGIGGGAVYAAQDTLPGDALYPLKTAVERFQVFASSSDADAAALHMRLAGRRAHELERALAQGRASAAADAADAYIHEVNAVRGRLG